MVIAVAAVALVGLLVWGLVGRGGGEPTASPTPSVTPSETTSPTQETTDPVDQSEEPTAPEEDWGPVTPPNVDALRDLWTDPELPAAIGPFELEEDPLEDVGSIMASYFDEAEFRSISVLVARGGGTWASLTSDLENVAEHGNAVCGSFNDGIGDQWSCVVAGANTSVLEVGTAGVDVITIEELAEFTNTLYDQL